MSIAVSISCHPDDIWTAQSATFDALKERVCQRFPTRREVLEQIEFAEVTNGVALDVLYASKPSLALELTDALLVAARELAGDPSSAGSHFQTLVSLLSRFPRQSA